MARIARTWRLIGRFARDRRGISAVEFAMILPLMVSLFLGGAEVTQGVAANRKVTLVARTVTDLVAQATSVTDSDMTNILNAAAAVAAPFPLANLQVKVSSVTIDNQGVATVAWGKALNTAARSNGDTVTLPSALATPNTSLIWGEVTYAYTPNIGYMITGTINLSDQIYMRPRLSDSVILKTS